MTSQVLGNTVINDRLISSWIRCKRKAWLDLYEMDERKSWSAHRALQLHHQYKCISAFVSQRPKKGEEACKKGAAEIIGLHLKEQVQLGLTIEAHPPLIHKVKGKSRWGNYAYTPVAVKQGTKITREVKLLLALWGELLNKLQKVEVGYGLTISMLDNNVEVEKIYFSEKIKIKLYNLIKKIHQDLRQDVIPPLTNDRKKCSLCSWKSLCDQKAKEVGDLSEISGIGAKRKSILLEMGINNILDLASANANFLNKRLNSHGDNHNNISEQLIKQANAQINLTPIRLNDFKILPELTSAEGVLIYDIESDPDIHNDFLHGFILIKKNNDGNLVLEDAIYDSILNITLGKENLTWLKIKNKLKAYKKLPILHYGNTEYQSIYKLAKKHGESEEEIKSILNNFVDIHSRLIKSWVLPVRNYSLKTIANWLDFSWQDKGANGAKALLYWREIEQSLSKIGINEDKKLNWIIQYNKDDCIATWKIAEWITKKDSEV